MKLFNFLLETKPDGIVIALPEIKGISLRESLECGKYARFPYLSNCWDAKDYSACLLSMRHYDGITDEAWLFRDIYRIEPIVDYAEVEKYGADENILLNQYLLVVLKSGDTEDDISRRNTLNNAPIKLR